MWSPSFCCSSVVVNLVAIAINCLVIKLAGHSELTTKTVFCCHFFSFKPFVFKFRVPLAKKGFFMVASMILLSTSVFPRLWIFQEIKSDILKNVEVELQRMSKCKISFLVIRYLHIIRWHALSVLRKKSSKEHLVFPLNLMRQFWFLQPYTAMMTFCITCKNHSGLNYTPIDLIQKIKMSHLNLLILAFFTNFWPIKIDLSCNSVWL